MRYIKRKSECEQHGSREILFRGKDKDDEYWYEGNYLCLSDTTYCFTEDYERLCREGKDPRHHYIIFDQMTDWGLPNRHLQVEVTPESVCEWSGIIDTKNHMRIFEKDIIKVENTKIPGTSSIFLVKFFEKEAQFVAAWGEAGVPLCNISKDCTIEVVGNEIDNPQMAMQIPNITTDDFNRVEQLLSKIYKEEQDHGE